jgi:signal transduction histidine kinase
MMQDVDHTIQSLRKIATELRPGILDSLGLIPSLRWLVNEFEKRSGIKCLAQFIGDNDSFEKEISTCFFRICQEALTNISKHAKATEVSVRMTREGKAVLLKISDNGKGMANEKLENPFSMGLLGMRERANLIGAQLLISSQPGKGTTVKLKKNMT